MLIIFAGLPGVGKSTIANELARRLEATYLRIDSVEQSILRSSLGIEAVEEAGYLVGFSLAEDNLALGRTVVADSVNPLELTRTAWRIVAERAGVSYLEVEIVCSDIFEHKRRVEEREVNIPDLKLPTWEDVQDREYHPWTEDHLIIDASVRSVEESVSEIVARLGP